MFILCVRWEASVPDGQLLALQEGSAVVWMAKQSSINFWHGKALSHLQGIQTTSKASLASYSVHAQSKAAGP